MKEIIDMIVFGFALIGLMALVERIEKVWKNER